MPVASSTEKATKSALASQRNPPIDSAFTKCALGHQQTPFSDKPKPQIWLQFELVDESVDDTRNYTVSRFYTLTLNKKSALRTDLEGWRGGALTPDELKGFDVLSMINIPCQVVVGHREKEGIVRTEIRSISALPKGLQAAAAKSATLIFDMDTR